VRLALVVPGGVDRGGRERVIPALLGLIERLARRHDVHVFALAQEEAPSSYPLLGARIHNLGMAAHSRWPGQALVPVHRALAAGFRAHGSFDLVHAFWANNPGFLAALAARRHALPLVLSLGGGELVGFEDIGYGSQLLLKERLKVRWALKSAARVTAASGSMVALALRHGVDAALVPLGVSRESFSEPLPRDAAPRLLLVGSLNRVKDVPTALRAFRRVVDAIPAARLDVVGEDVLSGEIPRAASALGLSASVTFHGFLTVDALRPFFRQADLLVHSSRHEAGPLVVLEAAACGVPAVGTAVGHIRDFAEATPARALAVAPGDDAGLASGILALLGDEPRRRAMGEAAREWARTHDADSTAAAFETIYAELLAGGSAGR
jgi:glycosyltransferase involved in cell wall biosynthesis